MMKIILFFTFLSLATPDASANHDGSVLEKINIIQQTLEGLRAQKHNPELSWEALEKFEATLYFVFAHDPTSLSSAEVPQNLRSKELTQELRTVWSGLALDAKKYGIDSATQEWKTISGKVELILSYRDSGLFTQSRNILKNGGMMNAIDSLHALWINRWYELNPDFNVAFDDSKILEIKKTIEELRKEIVISSRSPSSAPTKESEFNQKSIYTLWLGLLGLVVLGQYFYYRKKYKNYVLKENEQSSGLALDGLAEELDYKSWIDELSDEIDNLLQKRSVQEIRSQKIQSLNNTLSELKIGVMLAESRQDLEKISKKFEEFNQSADQCLDPSSSKEEDEAFERVMKLVLKLCVAIENKISKKSLTTAVQ